MDQHLFSQLRAFTAQHPHFTTLFSTSPSTTEILHCIQTQLPFVLGTEDQKELRKAFSWNLSRCLGFRLQVTSLLSAISWGQNFFKICISLCIGTSRMWSPWEGPFLAGPQEESRCRNLHPLPCILPWSLNVFLKNHTRIPGSANSTT